MGAIVLYTYVFAMLAPPEGGSFDPSLPMKNPPKENTPPEEIPLLTNEPEPMNENEIARKDGKVIIRQLL